jgi:hypothetical protein
MEIKHCLFCGNEETTPCGSYGNVCEPCATARNIRHYLRPDTTSKRIKVLKGTDKYGIPEYEMIDNPNYKSPQDLKTENKQVIPENVKPYDEIYELLWNKLKQKDWFYIKEALVQSTVNARDLNSYFWKKSIDHARSYTRSAGSRSFFE